MPAAKGESRMRLPGWVLPVCCLLLAVEVRAQPSAAEVVSSEAMVEEARGDLRTFKARLGRAEATLEKEDLAKIRTALEATEKALDAYARKLKERSSPDKSNSPLIAAAGMIVADDASGIGLADDVLLPVIALAVLVEQRLAQNTAVLEQLEATNLQIRVQTLLFALQVALAKKKNDGKCHCKCARLGEMGESQQRRTPQECKDRCDYLGFPVSICK